MDCWIMTAPKEGAAKATKVKKSCMLNDGSMAVSGIRCAGGSKMERCTSVPAASWLLYA